MEGPNIQRTDAAPARPAANPKIPAFLVEDKPWYNDFIPRLFHYLTEPAGKLPPVTGELPFVRKGFGSSFSENLREFFKPVPRSLQGPVRSRMLVEHEPERHAFAESLRELLKPVPRSMQGPVRSRMLVSWNSGLGVFWQNLRDLIIPPKLPPLRVTSKPVKVRDIWSKNEHYSRAQSLSVLVHILAGLILIFPFAHMLSAPPQAENRPIYIGQIDLSDYVPKLPPGKDPAGGGGGGGERNPIPASKGKLPQASLKPQLTPPVVKLQNLKPILPAVPTVVMPPEIHVPQPNLPNTGDPLAAMVTDSAGPGFGGGIGSGNGGGVGSGRDGGVGPGWGGGIGGGPFRAGHDGIGVPTCVYCPRPEYSDEARKARVQGAVILRVTVLPDGRVIDPIVIKGLGLGLDEKALQGVLTWRLTPATGRDGKPVAVSVDIEVDFHLL